MSDEIRAQRLELQADHMWLRDGPALNNRSMDESHQAAQITRGTVGVFLRGTAQDGCAGILVFSVATQVHGTLER